MHLSSLFSSYLLQKTRLLRKLKKKFYAYQVSCVPEMSTFDELESALEDGCRDGTLPGIVLQACNSSGSFRYSKAFGPLCAEQEEGAPRNVTEDSIFVLSSCTKLMTSIAALQCVERGQVTLDEDLSKWLPEVAKLEVLTGFDDQDMPVFEQRQKVLKLRHLLSHSSGLAYPIFPEHLRKYVKQAKDPKMGKGRTVTSRFGTLPLAFEPGTDWMYGSSIDWAGRLVERLNGDITLEEYMQRNIWKPLGIRDITFWPLQRPDMKDRLVGMSRRKGDGTLMHSTEPGPADGLDECFGGQGAFAAMPEYLKILHSIMVDDGKLLKKETAALLSTPQLEDRARTRFNEVRPRPGIFDYVIGEFNESPLDHGLGGMVTLTEHPGWRAKGTVIWGGSQNMFWYINRQDGICGIFGAQVLPPGDPKIRKLISLFERTMLHAVSSQPN